MPMLKRLRPWLLSTVLVSAAILIVLVLPTRVTSKDDLPRLMGLIDHWTYYVPSGYFLDQAIHRGEFPLWNPLTFCGTPFAANPTAFAFYPPNVLRSALTFGPTPLKTHVGIAIMLGLHLLMAGVATFFFARRQRLSEGASMTAVFVFLFSAGFVRRTCATLCWITTAAWLPVILLLLHSAFASDSHRRKLAYSAAAGLVFGISILAGSPHMCMFMSVTIAAYGILYRLTALRRADFRQPGKLAMTAGTDLAAGLLIVGIAASVAAVLLLPAAELSGLSDRGNQPNAVRDIPHSFLWMMKVLATYSGEENQWHDYRLAGLGALLLALAALIHPHRRNVLIFAALFLVFIDISLGPPRPLARLFIWLAPYRLNHPSRAMMWACFPLGLLAGFGVDAVAARWQDRRLRPVFTACIACLGVPLLLFLWTNTVGHQYLPRGTWSVVALPAAILGIIILSGCLWRSSGTGPGRDAAPAGRVFRTVTWVLPILLLIELATWSRHYLPFLLDWKGYEGSGEALDLRHSLWSGNYRGFDAEPNKALMDLAPSINGYDPLYISRALGVMRNPPRYRATLKASRTTQNSHRPYLFLKRSFWLAKQYAIGPLPGHHELFPPTTTVFLSTVPEDMPLPRLRREDVPRRCISETVERIDLGDAAALAKTTVRNRGKRGTFELKIPTREVPSAHKALRLRYRSDTPVRMKVHFRDMAHRKLTSGRSQRLASTRMKGREIEIPMPDFGRIRVALSVVQDDPGGHFEFLEAYLLIDREDEDGRIDILSRTANTAEVQLNDLPGPRVLTFVDAAYPGWKAYLDGAPTPILLANEAFKAVVVPPGTHRVRFVFRPARTYVGMAVSALTVLGIGLFLAAAFRRARS